MENRCENRALGDYIKYLQQNSPFGGFPLPTSLYVHTRVMITTQIPNKTLHSQKLCPLSIRKMGTSDFLDTKRLFSRHIIKISGGLLWRQMRKPHILLADADRQTHTERERERERERVIIEIWLRKNVNLLTGLPKL